MGIELKEIIIVVCMGIARIRGLGPRKLTATAMRTTMLVSRWTPTRTSFFALGHFHGPMWGPHRPGRCLRRLTAHRDRLHPLRFSRALQHVCNTRSTFAHPVETLATYVQNSRNTCDIRLEHLQNTRKNLKTHVQPLQIYANIKMKHLQHTYENT
jgi:hypothetical protein